MHTCLHVILDLLGREAAPDASLRLCRLVRASLCPAFLFMSD